jgi:hypothetical protein
MIEHYDFGEITINGKRYFHDLIVFHTGKIKDNWWRVEGHRLSMEDIKDILKDKPEILVIGSGYDGLMRVDNNVIKTLKDAGIDVIVKKSVEACKVYNELKTKSKKVALAIHLTC